MTKDDAVECNCLGCAAGADPENAELLNAMAGVYPGGPNCKKVADDLVIVIYEAEPL